MAEDVIGTIQVEFNDGRTARPPTTFWLRSPARRSISRLWNSCAAYPPTGKAVQVQLRSIYPDRLLEAAGMVRSQFDSMAGLQNIEDDRHIPGIEWQIAVDRAQAQKFGADIVCR